MFRLLLPTLAVAALASGCVATSPKTPQPEIEHVAVHEITGRTRAQLCTAARDWAALTFKDSKAVVEVFDPAEGKLIGKGRTRIAFMASMFPVDFTLVVECKDGRGRSSFGQLVAYSSQGNAFRVADSPSEVFRGNVAAEAKRLDAELVAYLKRPKLGGEW